MWRLRGREKYIRSFGGGGEGGGGPEGTSSSADQGVDGNIKMNLKERNGRL